MTGKEACEKMEMLLSAEERAKIAVEFLNDPKSYKEIAIGWGESYLPVRDDGQEVARMARDGIGYLLNVYTGEYCSQKVSTEALRGHLCALATGNVGDDQIAEHLMTGCATCKQRAKAIRALEPIIRDHESVRVTVT